jgi:DNA-binding NarL/FixJ family response regulator
MSTVRILLADDHTLVRAGIRALLKAIEGAEIVAEADNGRDAIALAQQHRPDIAILDISMKELNGIEALSRIKGEQPGVRVLMLSMHTTEDFVRRALKAGADGYIVKDSAPLELQLGIEAVMRGESYISPRVSRHLVTGLMGGAPTESSIDSLTPRQREILQMIAEGRSTKEMAFSLELSAKTVESHRAALMERLGIRDVAGLVIYAVRHGLVAVEPRENPE